MKILTSKINRLIAKGDIKGLSKALKHHDTKTRKIAADALDQLGWNPPELDDEISYYIAKMDWGKLHNFREASVLPLANLVMNSEDEDFRNSASLALVEIVKLNYDTALSTLGEFLCKKLIHPNLNRFISERNRIVEVFGRTGEANAVKHLIESVKTAHYWQSMDPYNKKQRFAFETYSDHVAQVIKEIGVSALPILSELMTSDAYIPLTAILHFISICFVSIGPPAIDYIEELLESDENEVRDYAVFALMKIDDDRIPNLMIRCLKDNYSLVRIKATRYLITNLWQPPGLEEKAYLLFGEILDSNSQDGKISNQKAKDLIALGSQAVDPLINSLLLEGKVNLIQRGYLGMPDLPTEGNAGTIAFNLLRKMGKITTPYLEKALENSSPDLKEEILCLLQEIN